jgi:hypothetical protein
LISAEEKTNPIYHEGLEGAQRKYESMNSWFSLQILRALRGFVLDFSLVMIIASPFDWFPDTPGANS